MEIENVRYILTNQLETDSKMIYKCDEGYFPYPDLARTCLFNGKWRPEPQTNSPQRCKLIECPDPTVIENGDVYPSQPKYYVGNETTYECYSAYRLQGSYRRVCLPNAKWSGYTPICTRDTGEHCSDPGVPPGASKSGNGFRIDDDDVKGLCGLHKELDDDSYGLKRDVYPWWAYITIKDEGVPEFYDYDVALVLLEEAVQITHESRPICLPCTVETNVALRLPADATCEQQGDSGGAVFKDYNGRTVQVAVVSWGNMETCIKDGGEVWCDCTEEGMEIENGAYTLTRQLETGSMLIYTCARGYFPYPKLTRRCQSNGEWEPPPQTNSPQRCKLIECPDPTVLEYGDVYPPQSKYYVGNETTYECYSAYRLQGSYRRVCLPNAKWSGYTPVCTRDSKSGTLESTVLIQVSHLVPQDKHTYDSGREVAQAFGGSIKSNLNTLAPTDIYAFGIGVEISDVELQDLTTGTGGRHYFRMDKINDLRDVFQEMIDDDDVKGLCGLHKELDDDSYGLKRDVYPWWAYITIKDEGVPEFYDYDVALVLLEEAVQITHESRPICLPCTVETNVALRLRPDATCEQQEQLLLRERTESVSFLSKKSGEVFDKGTWVHLGNSRPACIHGAKKPDYIEASNWTDIAVTENFMCSAVKDGYRNSISCKGDSGGAVFKDYNGRTVQVAVVSWGNTEKCKNHATSLITGQRVCKAGKGRPCYKLAYFSELRRKLNFVEAELACRRDGGQLLSVESASEQKIIEQLIAELRPADGDFWIGLRRNHGDEESSSDCSSQYYWLDGSKSTFRNWHWDEPSCGYEVCVVMYHQPSAPPDLGGLYMFQWNDDNCETKNNFICKYTAENPPGPLPSPNSTHTALNLVYIIIPTIPLILLLLTVIGVCCFKLLVARRRKQQKSEVCQTEPGLCPSPTTADVYNVIRSQKDDDLVSARPQTKNTSFLCSSPDTPTGDYDNLGGRDTESGFVTLASTESCFLNFELNDLSLGRRGTRDFYDTSLGRSGKRDLNDGSLAAAGTESFTTGTYITNGKDDTFQTSLGTHGNRKSYQSNLDSYRNGLNLD
ncbi:hypothetical protein INR49_027823, partial [Caranx melampygus]